jgi:IclR family pca regulon transcriptional regulator
MVELGQAALKALIVPDLAEPYLQSLHARTNQSGSVNLAILEGGDVVYLTHIESDSLVSLKVDVGTRLPAYCTAMGHVLLAPLPDHEIRRRLNRCSFDRRGPNTLTSLTDLLARLAEVRARGYAVTIEELAAGVRAVAAPIRDHAGVVIAAVNASVLTEDPAPDKLVARLVPFVVDTAKQISEALSVRRVSNSLAARSS